MKKLYSRTRGCSLLLIGLCLLLLLPKFLGFANVKAQGNDQSQQVPPPHVSATNGTLSEAVSKMYSYGWQYVVNIQHGADFNCLWNLAKVYSDDGAYGTGLEASFSAGQIVNGMPDMIFSFKVQSGAEPGGMPCCGSPPWGPNQGYPAAYINCSEGTFIPIDLFKCRYVDVTTSNITYEGNIPTFTNNFTFHDLELPTYGQGASNLTLTFATRFTADWTALKVKTSVYADLGNMKLFHNDGSMVPPGTLFSLNIAYLVSLAKYTNATHKAIIEIPPADVTQTGIHFRFNVTEGVQISIADMTLGENFTEVQDSHEIANRTTDAYFGTSMGEMVWCLQKFTNLTYGVTTAVRSDPTIMAHHEAVPPGWSWNSGSPNIALPPAAVVGGIVAAAAVIAVVVVIWRRRR